MHTWFAEFARQRTITFHVIAKFRVIAVSFLDVEVAVVDRIHAGILDKQENALHLVNNQKSIFEDKVEFQNLIRIDGNVSAYRKS